MEGTLYGGKRERRPMVPSRNAAMGHVVFANFAWEKKFLRRCERDNTRRDVYDERICI